MTIVQLHLVTYWETGQITYKLLICFSNTDHEKHFKMISKCMCCINKHSKRKGAILVNIINNLVLFLKFKAMKIRGKGKKIIQWLK